MIDSTVKISLALHANKGAYAVLLGSGVSAVSGIPTGWQIVLDLITKIARLESGDVGDDPAAWYKLKYGHDPDYSGLLDAVANSPTERNLLLRGYFEPTKEEHQNGIKVPTAAHHAMAQLVASGHVHLFVTTNFDRLLEKALGDIGIVPQVLSNPDSIEGAVPFGQSKCTIVKINGDYMDTRIKNTPKELMHYEPAINSLLDRIIDEYGFIVSGWSAEWDIALRQAFERCKSYRYTTYWTSRNQPRVDAARLIELRRGEFVQIKNPDTFFNGIVRKVAMLKEHELTTKKTTEAKDQNRSLEAIMFTDIQGYTALMQQDENKGVKMRERHREIFNTTTDRFGGNILQYYGDGTLSIFRSVVDAVNCALEMQLAFQKEPSVPVRVGIHLGDIIVAEDEVIGDAVNVASRIESMAVVGSVLVSDRVQQDIKNHGEIQTQSLGIYELKNVEQPIEVFAISNPGLIIPEADQVSEKVKPYRPEVEHNLPNSVTSFVGRESEIEELGKVVRETRCVTLIGSGGAGKTRLSVEVGSRSLAAFPDGVWMVDLSSITDQNLVMNEVAKALKVAEYTIPDFLSKKQLLIIMDNCEHLVDECARVVNGWMNEAPQVHILATSREALNIPGEVIRRIPSLSQPESSDSSSEVLMSFDAIRLFVERAKAVQEDFELTEYNSPAIIQIIRRLDGIPLAIELAAARTKALSVEQIASRLKDCFSILSSGNRTAVNRQKTIQGAIDWSYQLLTEEETWLFNRLCVFRGGFTLEHVEQICSGGDYDPTDIMDLLLQLVDKSMVSIVGPGPSGGLRYELLESLRQYAEQRLSKTANPQEPYLRHASYFTAFAGEVDGELWNGTMKNISQLAGNYDNIRAALGWALEVGEAEIAVRMVGNLSHFWMIHRHIKEGREWAERALSVKGDVPDDLRAAAILSAAMTAMQELDQIRSRKLYEEGIRLYKESGNLAGAARTTYFLAGSYWFGGDLQDAEPLLIKAEKLNRKGKDIFTKKYINYILGAVTASRGETEKAWALMEGCLKTFQKANDSFGRAHTLVSMASMARDRSDYVEAIRLFEDSLPLLRAVGDRAMVGMALAGLATIAWIQDDKQKALSLQQESMAECKAAGDYASISWAVGALRFGMRSPGDTDWVLELYRERDNMTVDSWIKSALAENLYALGNLSCEQNNLERAYKLLHDSLTLSNEIGHAREIVIGLLGMANLAKAQEDFSRAVRLFGAAEAVLNAKAVSTVHYENSAFESIRLQTEAQIGAETFIRLRAEGSAMSIDEAVKFALEDST